MNNECGMLLLAIINGIHRSTFRIYHSFIFYKKNNMEAWELDFEWLQVRHKVKDMMNLDKLPDLNGVLFLVGVQEYGRTKEKFTKEEIEEGIHPDARPITSEQNEMAPV